MERSMKLTLRPKWDEIEKVRNGSGQFLTSHGCPNDTVHAVTMVVSELIENSIKYGIFAIPEDKVTVDIYVAENIITVEVTNPVDETAENHLENLDRTIQWIRGYQDPFEAYIERLKDVSKKPLANEESGLGLVRMAYEGNAILDFFVGEDNILNVSAVSDL